MSNNIFKKVESSLAAYAPRTRFDRSKHHLTSLNAGRLYPIYVEECLPGDTWQLDLHSLVRMQTPMRPIMDDIFGDYYFFFIPYRLLDENFEKVISISDWSGSISTELLTLGPSSGGSNMKIYPSSFGHYLGLPIGVYDVSKWRGKISNAPFAAYCMIWNEFFRDENYQSPINWQPGTSAFSMGSSLPLEQSDEWLNSNGSFYITPMSPCAPVNERHDLFTSVLPSPQRGDSVVLPLGDTAPIYGLANAATGSNEFLTVTSPDLVDGGYLYKFDTDARLSNGTDATNIKMYVDLADATSATINNLREAIVMQHFLETLARTGSRYTEYLKGFWGVNAPDARLQRPEFIAEWHTNINVSEVIQTAGVDEASGTTLGSTGGISRTGTSKNGLFTYSCVEHGFLMGFYVVRHKLSYSQGISNMWFRKKGTDFYNPVFNGLGETPVLKRSILAPVGYDSTIMKAAYSNAGSSVDFDDILGFNEAWSEYKFTYNQVSGLLNPVALEGLDFWTLTKAFTTADITGADVRVASDATLDRALAIENQDQFICDFYFDVKCTRRMPLRSTPGVNRI